MRPILKRRTSRKRSGRVAIDPGLMEIERSYKSMKKSPHIKTVDSAKAKRFSKLNKNRYCSDIDFTQCIDRDIGLMGDPIIIGNGTFGVLLRAGSSKGDVAIKFIFNINRESSADRFIDMEKELAFSYYMGDIGIGPVVLDSFYYNFDFGELPQYPVLFKIVEMIDKHFEKKKKPYPQFAPIKSALLHSQDPGSLPIEIQCIVMKAYDSDCADALEDPKIPVEAKEEIIKQMVKLMEIQITDGLYCYDVKPGNFVVNIDTAHHKVDVKMIDFGADFCTEKRIFFGFKNEDPVPFLGINFIQLLYISNVIQIFSLFVQTNIMDNMSTTSALKLLKAFFNHPLFNVFFSKDWKSFVNWYIDYAHNNYVNNKNDPSNNVVWYSNASGTPTIYSKVNLDRTKAFLIKNLDKLLVTIKSNTVAVAPPPGFHPIGPKRKSKSPGKTPHKRKSPGISFSL